MNGKNFSKKLSKKLLGALVAANFGVMPLSAMWSSDEVTKKMHEVYQASKEVTNKYVVQPVKNNPKVSMVFGGVALVGAGYWYRDYYYKNLQKNFIEAVKENDLKKTENLVWWGAGLEAPDTCWGMRPIHWAAHNNCYDVFKFLVAQGAQPNSRTLKEEGASKERATLSFAMDYGIKSDVPQDKEHNFEIIKFLVEKGAHINDLSLHSETDSLFQQAVFLQKHEVVELFIKNGVKNIDQKDNCNRTPLHIAVKNDDCKMANILVKAGADVNAKHDYSAQEAIFDGQNLSRQDTNGYQTALEYAIQHKNVAMVQCLLDHGANPNTCNKYKQSVLHRAIIHARSLEIVKLLVEKKADLEIEYFGNTPYKHALPVWAQSKGKEDLLNEIAEYLKSKGAYVEEKEESKEPQIEKGKTVKLTQKPELK